MTRLALDATELERLTEWAMHIPEKSEDAINRALHDGESGEVIRRDVDALINPSGRTFKGHSHPAKGADWAHYNTSENLALTVQAKGKYSYLYFPDDGSNTRRHAGQQRFFERGGKQATPEVIDMCISEIIKELN